MKHSKDVVQLGPRDFYPELVKHLCPFKPLSAVQHMNFASFRKFGNQHPLKCAGLHAGHSSGYILPLAWVRELCWAKSGGALQSVVKYIVRNGGREREMAAGEPAHRLLNIGSATFCCYYPFLRLLTPGKKDTDIDCSSAPRYKGQPRGFGVPVLLISC